MGKFLIRLTRIDVKQLWAITILVGIFVFINTHPIRPHDFWWHLALGKEIAATYQIPSRDIFSFTMFGQAYPSYQMFWFFDLGLYAFYLSGGPALVILVTSIIITSAYAIIMLICWQSSRHWGATALALFFAAALGIHNWNVRPQVISYLIGAAFLYAIYAYRRNPGTKWLAVFPIGMLVWVNSHGSFPIGFILLGIWLGDEIWNQIVRKHDGNYQTSLLTLKGPGLALLLSGLVLFINPRGPGIITYVANLSGNPVIQNLVPEWAPPTFDNQIGIIFYLGLILCSVVLAISPRRPNFFQMAFYICFAILSLMTTRGIVWFGLVMAPVLAVHFAASAEHYFNKTEKKKTIKYRQLLNTLFVLILGGMAIISLPWFKHRLPFEGSKSGLISKETPEKATDLLLEQGPPGYLFNEMGFGSYLIWAAQPRYQVFVDPRIELFTSEIWNDYIYISNALPGWQQKLNEYGINTLMLSPAKQANLIAALGKANNWSSIYQDESAHIYTRK